IRNLKTAKAMGVCSTIDLPTDVRDAVTAVLKIAEEVVGQGLQGAYLFGSGVLGGLRSTSDLDVMIVIEGSLAHSQRSALVAALLTMSGRWPVRGSQRPLEVTVVSRGDLNPWRYPPR